MKYMEIFNEPIVFHMSSPRTQLGIGVEKILFINALNTIFLYVFEAVRIMLWYMIFFFINLCEKGLFLGNFFYILSAQS